MHFEANNAYHIYNRGNEKQTIFFAEKNYLFFLQKVKYEWLRYADVLAYCIMPNHFHFIIVPSLDGCQNIEDNTDIVRMTRNRTVWNHNLAYEFQSLEEMPKTVVLSMLRKRSVHQNYQLVGTARFSTKELLPILDKWSIERKMMIYVPHQTQASGTLTISASLRSSDPSKSTKFSPNLPMTADRQDESVVGGSSSLITKSSSCDRAAVSSVLQLVLTFFVVVSLLIYQIMV